jgi:pilus assembly protein Flp/PilA
VLKRFLQDEAGATAIEYGLIASLIAVAIIGGFGALADALEALWGDSNGKISDAFE